MPSLTLKNVPDELLKALRVSAERDRRSLTQQVIYLLESAAGLRLESARDATDDVEAQVEAWRQLAGRWASDVEVDAETEAILARRTHGREVVL